MKQAHCATALPNDNTAKQQPSKAYRQPTQTPTANMMTDTTDRPSTTKPINDRHKQEDNAKRENGNNNKDVAHGHQRQHQANDGVTKQQQGQR